jgi:hypothetical protein
LTRKRKTSSGEIASKMTDTKPTLTEIRIALTGTRAR